MDNENNNQRKQSANSENSRDKAKENFINYLAEVHNNEQFKLGLKHSSYVAGFASGFLMFDLSKNQIEEIIISKMNLEAQLESLRLSLESAERTAQIYADNEILMTRE
jgi:hypothetical protein